MNKIILNIYEQIKTRALKDRIIMGLSGLLFVFVFPITVFRLINLDWTIFLLDLFMITSAALIFISTYNRRNVEFARIYMCVLVSIGSSMSVIANGAQQFYWVYPASLTMFFLVSNKIAFLLVFIICILTFPVMYSNLDGMHLATAYIALFGSTMFIFVFSSEVKQENSQLDTLVNVDFLTKCGNRRAFDMEIRNRIKEFEIHNIPSSLIVLDLDDFKILNDTYGHAVGDNVLRDLSDSVRSRLRKSDNIYRLGGEEFAILVSNADEKAAKNITQDIMTAISTSRAQDLPIYTVSMGVATIKSGQGYNAWIDKSDQAMYEAKRSGKNKIVFADHT